MRGGWEGSRGAGFISTDNRKYGVEAPGQVHWWSLSLMAGETQWELNCILKICIQG